ncbi:collagen alpha-1(I) chain-like [Meles meles]|uniref:collagen alpha-1(I) chain-like n=1 Tax=Meles meles TaxID=9662 RepID=UPI001E69DA05|nr:collagen alpha-1(I) chain-like [Meles meles]
MRQSPPFSPIAPSQQQPPELCYRHGGRAAQAPCHGKCRDPRPQQRSPPVENQVAPKFEAKNELQASPAGPQAPPFRSAGGGSPAGPPPPPPGRRSAAERAPSGLGPGLRGGGGARGEPGSGPRSPARSASPGRGGGGRGRPSAPPPPACEADSVGPETALSGGAAETDSGAARGVGTRGCRRAPARRGRRCERPPRVPPPAPPPAAAGAGGGPGAFEAAAAAAPGRANAEQMFAPGPPRRPAPTCARGPRRRTFPARQKDAPAPSELAARGGAPARARAPRPAPRAAKFRQVRAAGGGRGKLENNDARAAAGRTPDGAPAPRSRPAAAGGGGGPTSHKAAGAGARRAHLLGAAGPAARGRRRHERAPPDKGASRRAPEGRAWAAAAARGPALPPRPAPRGPCAAGALAEAACAELPLPAARVAGLGPARYARGRRRCLIFLRRETCVRARPRGLSDEVESQFLGLAPARVSRAGVCTFAGSARSPALPRACARVRGRVAPLELGTSWSLQPPAEEPDPDPHAHRGGLGRSQPWPDSRAPGGGKWAGGVRTRAKPRPWTEPRAQAELPAMDRTLFPPGPLTCLVPGHPLEQRPLPRAGPPFPVLAQCL